MGNYPVDNSQIAIYLTFTLLSILASLFGYFYYNNYSKMALTDRENFMKLLFTVANREDVEVNSSESRVEDKI